MHAIICRERGQGVHQEKHKESCSQKYGHLKLAGSLPGLSFRPQDHGAETAAKNKKVIMDTRGKRLKPTEGACIENKVRLRELRRDAKTIQEGRERLR